MLARYIKSQIMVLICGGLVGPIFLAVYFATGQSVYLKWMFWVGLLITAADVLIALALANFGAKSAAKTAALEQSGVLALAQVVGIHETGTRINEQPLVKIDLQISGPGIAPFATQDLSGQAGPLMEILQILKANGIGLNNMIDVRANPAARAQVQAVVRRAAAAQQAPAAQAPAPAGAPSYAAPPEPTTAQRLQELETLRATGAISDDEYN